MKRSTAVFTAAALTLATAGLAQAQVPTLELKGTIRDFRPFNVANPSQTLQDFEQFDFKKLQDAQANPALLPPPGYAYDPVTRFPPEQYLPEAAKFLGYTKAFDQSASTNKVGKAETGIVANTITNADRTPTYQGTVPAAFFPTTHGQTNFQKFYHNDAAYNQSAPITLTLTDPQNDGIYSFSSQAFFPIDGQLLGNDGVDSNGVSHNFHFTTEFHTKFTYKGGEVFNFEGDDDLWLFINDKLVLDLGGVHNAITGNVNLNTLQLQVGKDYNFDLFYNERNTFASDIKIETSIQFQQPTPPAIPLPPAAMMGMVTLAGMGVYRKLRRQ